MNNVTTRTNEQKKASCAKYAEEHDLTRKLIEFGFSALCANPTASMEEKEAALEIWKYHKAMTEHYKSDLKRLEESERAEQS